MSSVRRALRSLLDTLVKMARAPAGLIGLWPIYGKVCEHSSIVEYLTVSRCLMKEVV